MKKTLRIISFILIVMVIVIFIKFAWSKYVGIINGIATAQIAEMKFKINDKYYQSTQEIEFFNTITQSNSKAEEGLLVPGTAGCIPIIIDASETQTSLEYEINIELKYRPTNLKFYSDEGRTEEILVKDNKIVRRGYILFDKENMHDKQKNETIYWRWLAETGENRYEIEENDKEDSVFMNKIMTMKIDVKSTQIDVKPTYIGDGEYGAKVGDIVNYKFSETGDYIRFMVVNKTDNKIEMVPVDNQNYIEYVKCNEKIRLGYQTDDINRDIQILEAVRSYNSAINKLNNAAKEGFLEKYGYTGSVRALTVEDVNRLIGYNPNISSDWYTYTRTNHEGQMFIVNELMKVKLEGTEDEIDATSLTKNGNKLLAGDTIVIGDTNNVVDQGIIKEISIKYKLGDYTNAYYHYSSGNTGDIRNVNQYFSASKGYCWLASRAINLNSVRCNYDIRFFDSGNGRIESFGIYNSDGVIAKPEFAVVPVISISSKMYASPNTQNGEWNVKE